MKTTIDEAYKLRCPFWWKLRVDRMTGVAPDPEKVLRPDELRAFREWQARTGGEDMRQVQQVAGDAGPRVVLVKVVVPGDQYNWPLAYWTIGDATGAEPYDGNKWPKWKMQWVVDRINDGTIKVPEVEP